MSNIILKNVAKSYGDKVAVNNISFEIKAGRICGLLGPNGAGKSSILKIISGILEADYGTILLDNSLMIGYLPEERGLYPRLTVLEHILYIGELHNSRCDIRQNALDLIEYFEITKLSNIYVDTLSKGNQQIVQVICALVYSPEIIILDEPMSGFDPNNIYKFTELIKQLSNEGRIILISTHDMNFAENICDDIVLINKGEIVLNQPLSIMIGTNNRYRIKGSGLITSNDKFIIINSNENEFVIETKGITNNELLVELMNYIEIEEFKIEKPSLVEIFRKYTNPTAL